MCVAGFGIINLNANFETTRTLLHFQELLAKRHYFNAFIHYAVILVKLANVRKPNWLVVIWILAKISWNDLKTEQTNKHVVVHNHTLCTKKSNKYCCRFLYPNLRLKISLKIAVFIPISTEDVLKRRRYHFNSWKLHSMPVWLCRRLVEILFAARSANGGQRIYHLQRNTSKYLAG